jgi:ribosomal protein RSM22 (predicted rRNA methylase)
LTSNSVCYQQPKTDLVLSAFTLGDTPSEALRRSTLQSLWDQTGDVLVLIERGTPVGFRIIAQAREWILENNSDVQPQNVHVVAPVSISSLNFTHRVELGF